MAQIRSPLLLVCLLEGLSRVAGKLAQRHPGQLTAGQVVALGLGPAALAFLGPGELLEVAVKLFHLPARAGRGLDHGLGERKGKVVGHDPLHVAV